VQPLQVQAGPVAFAEPHRVGDQGDQLRLADLVAERLSRCLGEERGLFPGRRVVHRDAGGQLGRRGRDRQGTGGQAQVDRDPDGA